MLVVIDLAGVQRHPEPDPLLVAVRGVVLAKRLSKIARDRSHKRALGHLCRDQNEDAIAAALLIAIGPRDASLAEGLPHSAVHSLAHREPVLVRAPLIAESLNVHDKDGSVDSWLQMFHLTSRPGMSQRQRSAC